MKTTKVSTKLYTTTQAAAMIGVAKSALRRWVQHGKVKCARTIGGHPRYTFDQINQIREDMDLPPIEEEAT